MESGRQWSAVSSRLSQAVGVRGSSRAAALFGDCAAVTRVTVRAEPEATREKDRKVPGRGGAGEPHNSTLRARRKQGNTLWRALSGATRLGGGSAGGGGSET
ncbi:hypothetical protein O3P69_006316 [Scylla paramamosain]|uniref:Uncharacterized protein n=1 Tax=Scylla paramamosain TaxID=85552 RepID=A0AAW0U1U8_SCYPA